MSAILVHLYSFYTSSAFVFTVKEFVGFKSLCTVIIMANVQYSPNRKCNHRKPYFSFYHAEICSLMNNNS